ncbi:hypothetical protein SAMN05444161_5847 [Rhizobiales bacterium GAS191]|nr:hypothetical protein SAMN05444161_5847 [Rhizobiales bacterium GAS191]
MARNYREEYRRRVDRALARGLSRSQARGHARSGEASIKRSGTKSDAKLEKALRTLRETNSQVFAAKNVGVSPERFRRFLREQSLAQREGRRWKFTDLRPREVLVTSKGRERWIKVAGFERASLVGSHNEAIKRFLETNDISHLEPFVGVSVRDTSGRNHPLETRPNILYRLAAAGGEAFEQVYRLIPST